MIRRVPARTADALHLACALFFSEAVGVSVRFLTADQHQRAGAEGLGMNVVWVDSPPSHKAPRR